MPFAERILEVVVKDREDAFGHMLLDFHEELRHGSEIVERDDGYFDAAGGPAAYFAEYRDWGPHEKKAMKDATGRVLDIGCGAGRHSLYLQRRGLDVLGIDVSPLAVKTAQARGGRERDPRRGVEGAHVRGYVREIYVARVGGAPMEAVEEVGAVADAGLQGDRYAERTGYWSGIDECQVTLIEGEVIDQIDRETDLEIEHGEHRRNVITRGVRLLDLAGTRFSVGEAILEFDRPRPPCRYIEQLTRPGMMAALGGGRGGICARVIESGVIRVNDVIEIIT